MKKTFLILSCFLILAAQSFAIMPNEKVLKSFETIFSNARQVKWFDHADYFEVTFLQANTRARVKFGTDGSFISSTRYYKEAQLPGNILWKLKKQYPGKKVFGITEITGAEEIYYFIKLEDEKNWTTIQVNGNGHMEQVEKFRKG